MGVLHETRMTMAEVAAYCRCNVQTVRRWVKIGSRGVKLESLALGRSFVTSREALERFLSAICPNKGN